MTAPIVGSERLPPLRQIRLYSIIATKMVKVARGGDDRLDLALPIALAAMAAVQDAIAVLREHQP